MGGGGEGGVQEVSEQEGGRERMTEEERQRTSDEDRACAPVKLPEQTPVSRIFTPHKLTRYVHIHNTYPRRLTYCIYYPPTNNCMSAARYCIYYVKRGIYICTTRNDVFMHLLQAIIGAHVWIKFCQQSMHTCADATATAGV